MKTSKQIKEERASVQSEIDTLSKLETRNDAQNDELSVLFEKRDSLTKALEVQMLIDAEETRKAVEAQKEARKAGTSGVEKSDSEAKELRNFSLTKLIVTAEGSQEARNVDAGFELEVLDQYSDAGNGYKSGAIGNQRSFFIPEKVLDAIHEKRSTMVTSTSTLGGNFIPTEKMGFFEALFAATVLKELGVRSLTGLSANMDLTGFTASVTSAWASSEIGTQTASNPTTEARELRPKLLYTASDISRRLLIQTNPSIDQFVLQNMMRSMAVAFEAAVINGAGTTEPLGILSSGISSVAIGPTGGAPTYAKILELIQVVLSADGSGAVRKFLTNPKVVSKLKQTTLDAGSGAMVMGYNGLFASQMGVIDGYSVGVTSNVPSNLNKSTTTGVCSALLFGDFSQVVTGQFGVTELIVDPYTAARNATIKYTVNQYLDSTVLQPTALGAIADLTTT